MDRERGRASGTCVLVVVCTSVVTGVRALDQPAAPAPSAPDLERAAGELASGRASAAREAFRRIREDPGRGELVRGLAGLGVAEAAWAADDIDGAIAAWQRLADSARAGGPRLRALGRLAHVRVAAARRIRSGRPGHDPAAHRAKLPVLPEPARVLHVAPGGRADADGSPARPFGSLSAARDAVRAWRRPDGRPPRTGSVQVLVHGGTYEVRESFELTAEDSGAEGAPVVYRAADGERPIFAGGVRVRGWARVEAPAIRSRLAPEARDRVLVIELDRAGIRDTGDPTDLRRRPELFCDGAPQTLARWPDEGFVHTGEVLGKDTFRVWNSIDGCRDGKFRFREDRPRSWVDEADVRLYGYWFWDWFEEHQRVERIDADERTFTLARPWSNYGYRKGQRYFAVNVLRELDRPGEWYLDRERRVVCWMPPAGGDPAASVTVISLLARPFVVAKEVEHLVLQGLTFQEGRGDGAHVSGGAGVLIAGCTFRRLGGDAVVVRGGRGHGLFGCLMHTLGCGGARIAGGSRETLTPGSHFVENCTVRDISRLKRTYTPAVHLDGCGHRIAHNLFEQMPSSAMRIEGNDQLIELNVIRRVVLESDDQGGLDMWGNPLYRGVTIRWNRWSDIGGGTACGGAGVRLDDMISGVTLHGNLFERCGAVKFGGIQIHGGKENLVDGNVFVDGFAGISFSRWGRERWLRSIERFREQAARPPYATRYPELAALTEGVDVSFLCRNVFSRCGPTLLRDGGVQWTALNVTTDRALDVSALSSPRAARDDPRLRRALLAPLPIQDMGPYDHPWRVDERGPR